MELIINEYGAFVGRDHERFSVKMKEKTEEYSADSVTQIIMLTPSTISTEAVKLAMENKIDIVIIGKFGEPTARIYPCKLGGTTLTRRRQLEACFSEKGTKISKAIVCAKLKNQAYFLKSLEKTRETIDFKRQTKAILELSEKVDACKGKPDDIRESLFGFEGMAANGYFECLIRILPFAKRDQDAPDAVNSVLNYGYGILYSEVERCCVLAGLDPYLGFLHTDRYGKPSMVLDLIENFRSVVVDRAVVTLYAQKQLSDADFEKEGDKFFLTKEARKKVVSSVMERLASEITLEGVKTSVKDRLLGQCRAVSAYLLDNEPSFSAFVYRW